MTRQERQSEINTLLSALAWLKNGGNHYSFVGRERLLADPIQVEQAITEIEDELSLVIKANYD